ncbi:MAG TPA: amino acid adenylation domain-containing protein [Chthonomonadales bacterium]|nr:amino acid adenylation domain-containing protein [Chthonomonadales bacterium]
MPADILDRLSQLPAEKRALLQRKLLERRASGAAALAITPRAESGPCELSFAQELMWLLDQLSPGITSYHVPRALRMKGSLNLSALEAGLNEIVARHDVLRTSYHAQGGTPIQVISASAPVALEKIDLRSLADTDREVEARRILFDEAGRPFDLSALPALRCTLLRLADNEYILLLVTHHIASDGWSKGVLFRELEELYTAFCEGRPTNLAPLPIQYADFACWQRKWLTGNVLDEQLGYWRKRLEGMPAALELPADRPRPAIQSGKGARRNTVYSKILGDGLKQLSMQEGCTLFMTLLTAFHILLSRYSGQTDIVIGTPVSGRTRTEIEGLIGYFSNSLVLRADLSGNPTYREALREVRSSVLGAFSHQDLPFEMLVKELQPHRDLSRTPVYQIMFSVGSHHTEQLNLPGLSITPLLMDRNTAKFDMTLGLRESPDALLAGVEYSTDLFCDDTMARLLDNFGTLLESIAANPDQNIRSLPVISRAEQRLLAVDWQQAETRLNEPDTVQALFEAQAARTPDAPALAFNGESLTYAELNTRSNRLAHMLRAHGIGPEMRAAISLERSLDMVVAVVAVIKAGGAYVALDPDYPAQRLSLMLRDSGAALLITKSKLLDRLSPDGVAVIALDGEKERISAQAAHNPAPITTASNLVYVVYTSGSTGAPKGVMVEHGSLVNAYLGWESRYNLKQPNSSHLQMANFSFDVFSGDLVRALCSGGKLVICPFDTLLDPEALYRLMRAEQITCAEFVPGVLRLLAQHLEKTGQCLDFMRVLIAGSDSWYVDEYRAFKKLCGSGCRLINSYGLAEATIDSSLYEAALEELPEAGLVPIGKPFPNTELYILDELQKPVPVGVPGELCIGGRGLARGYLGLPELTEARFIESSINGSIRRIYRTGDQARWLSSGAVEFLGRIDHQVKVRGFRVELGEVETALGRHPAIVDAVVTAYPSSAGDARLAAYIVTNGGGSTDGSDLRRFLGETLPAHMVPAHFLRLEAFPLTPNGKVDRSALPVPDQAETDALRPYTMPRTPIEQMIACLWTEVLGVEKVGITDNFFELGGHSLLATQVVSRLRESFPVEISLRDIFELPTVENLALRIVERLAAAPEMCEAQAGIMEL